jgi:hypothetical protein
MATQNLLQRLDTAEDTTGSSADASNRRIEEVFIASAALTAGDFVSLDLSQSTASDIALHVDLLDADDACPVGVVIADAAQGENVRVCIRGVIEAKVDGSGVSIAVGDALFVGSDAGIAKNKKFRTDLGDGTGTTTGNVDPVQAVAAIALEASTASESIKVFVVNNF